MSKLVDAEVDSTQSSGSASHSLIEVIHGETRRRKHKVHSIRENSEHGSITANKPRKKIHPGGIMTVRTLEESLVTKGLSGRRNKYKIKRRALKRALHGSTNSLDSFSLQASESSLSCSIDSPTPNNVSFHEIIIREYPPIPGVNPSVSRGCPVTLDWDHLDERTYNIDKFENVRIRRDGVQMRMPADYRTKLLRDHGHSWKVIQQRTKETNIARRKRQRTYERLDSQQFDEGLETLVRAFKKTFKNKNNKKKLQKESLKKSSSFDALEAPKKYKSDHVGLKPKQIHDLNTSRSKSASHYDLTLGADDGDYDLGSDDDEYLADDMASDNEALEDDTDVPTTVLTGSEFTSTFSKSTPINEDLAVKVSPSNNPDKYDSIRSNRTPATVIIQDLDEFTESNFRTNSGHSSDWNENGIVSTFANQGSSNVIWANQLKEDTDSESDKDESRPMNCCGPFPCYVPAIKTSNTK